MPVVAIFSSTEAKARAESLRTALLGKWQIRVRAQDLAVKVWYEPEKPSELISNILERIREADVALYMLEPDDQLTIRDKALPCARDNVVFELGLAMGLKGTMRAVATIPERNNRLLIHVPTDLAGATLYRYPRNDRADDPQQFDSVADALVKLLRAPAPEPSPTRPKRSMQGRLSSDNIVPIHRRVEPNALDWFGRFEHLLREQLGDSQLRLPSQLLYYGPGMARWWLTQADSSAANEQQRQCFLRFVNGHFARLLTTMPEPDAGKLGIVDLGVGAFVKARAILDAVAERPVQYVAYDISYDMVVDSLSRAARGGGWAAVTEHGGEMIGVNDEFAHLSSYGDLWAKTAGTLFCLLGNTLGNESAEDHTLKAIHKVMRKTDRLLLEVQLQDQVTEQQIADGAREHIMFYSGPFLLCGANVEHIEFDVRREQRPVGDEFSFFITFTTQHRISHVAFRNDVEIPEGRRARTYMVKKYEPTAFASMLEKQGFVSVMEPVLLNQGPRRFGYFCVKRADAP